MNLQTLKLDDLKPATYNPRIMTDLEFNGLVKSLETFGQQENLIVNKDMTLISGHQRLEAMKFLGWTEAMCNLVDLNKQQEKKLNALMNSQAISGSWDDLKLAEILDQLKLDEDYGSLRLDQLEPLDLSSKVEEDEAPEVSSEPPISKLGEIYQLGRHRLMCGDSTDKANVDLLMSGENPDVVYSDPPYGMNLDADYSKMNSKLEFVKDKHLKSKTGNKYANVIGDHADFDPRFITMLLDIGEDCKEVFLWGADYYAELLPDKNEGSWLVWDKRLDESSDKMYGSTFELVWSKSKHKRSIVRIKWAGVFGTEQEFDRKRHHPTQKPIKLSAYFIENYSDKEDKIVDLFGGSGSTLIACEQLDRICYMMELDPKYCDVIRKRYAKFIGKEEEWEIATPSLPNSEQS